MPHTYEYPRPAVTVDTVVFGRGGDGVQVLLIQRDKPPFEGAWAAPGGFVDMHEELEVAAARELREETGLVVGGLTQVGAFGGVNRDPRGRVIAVAFYVVVERAEHEPNAADDARDARWFPLDALPELAFDHDQVLARARAAAGL